MILSMGGQAVTFLAMAAAGAVLGLLFDMFRILRRVFLGHRVVATNIEDAIFWVAATLLIFAFLFDWNFGALRGYIFMGFILGAVLYFLMFSRFITRFVMALLRKIKRVFIIIFSPFVLACMWVKKRLKFGREYVRIKVQVKGGKIYRKIKGRAVKRDTRGNKA